MPTLTLVRGDRNYFVELEVRDSDDQVVDLTGASILFNMQKW